VNATHCPWARYTTLASWLVRAWLVLGALGWASAQAHLMVAQRGTLNLVGDGAFLVLSLPVSAFSNADTNRDGLLSPDELQAQAGYLQQKVLDGVQLWSDAGQRPLQGLMLQLSPADHTSSLAPHLVVMGRFSLDQQTHNLRLRLALFGTDQHERSQSIVVSQGEQAHRLELSPERPEGWVLPSRWRSLADGMEHMFVLHMREGIVHVLLGADHLLFLLVVLAAGGGWRSLLIALSAFTIGHAVTLSAVVMGGVRLPSSLVEPAIAATIVGMLWFDRWHARSHTGALAPAWRLLLVFVCALVHGLGLAGALTDQGLTSEQRIPALLGFNLGVELAQVAVASAVLGLLDLVNRFWGPAVRNPIFKLTRAIAWTAGTFWLLQRLAQAG
jgi:HupE / UreJ protein